MSSTMESSTPVPITPADSPLLTLTDKAIEKVKYFAGTMPDSEGKPLRIFVQGGGCSGFQYGFTFDENRDKVMGGLAAALGFSGVRGVGAAARAAPANSYRKETGRARARPVQSNEVANPRTSPRR